MDQEAFERWLAGYFAAWVSNDPADVASLFAEDARNVRATDPSTGVRSEMAACWRSPSRRTAGAASTGSGSRGGSCGGIEPVTLTEVRAGWALEHRAGAEPRPCEPAGRHPAHADDAPSRVEEHHRDRETHAERVHRTAPREQHRVVRGKEATVSQTAHPFPSRHRDLDVPDPAARVHELRAPHTRTVSGLTDTGHREVGRAGFEPATRGLKAPCSNRAELPPLPRL